MKIQKIIFLSYILIFSIKATTVKFAALDTLKRAMGLAPAPISVVESEDAKI
ncbi:MAG: hypothetical protein WC707_01620 [Candidatus Babeliaceae bacterium]|jgi:hypothetical protein